MLGFGVLGLGLGLGQARVRVRVRVRAGARARVKVRVRDRVRARCDVRGSSCAGSVLPQAAADAVGARERGRSFYPQQFRSGVAVVHGNRKQDAEENVRQHVVG